MRIIFGRHDCMEKEFIWAVPDGMDIRRGDVMLVDTKYGKTVATATSGVIEGNDLTEAALRLGAYLPLKKVISFCGGELRTYMRNRFLSELTKKLDVSINGMLDDFVNEEAKDAVPF